MKKNLYYEYRKWAPFWGLFLDGKKEVQKVLDKHNQDGWYVVQFEWGASWKFSLIKLLLILFFTAITLGFFSYWSGFTIIFEKDDSEGSDAKSTKTSKAEAVESASLKSKTDSGKAEEIKKLYDLIKQQKNSFFSSSKTKQKIIELMEQIFSSVDMAENVLIEYKETFGSDLVADVKKLTTSYDGMKQYLWQLIELKIISADFPHDRIKNY